jgi:hypothetical protein
VLKKDALQERQERRVQQFRQVVQQVVVDRLTLPSEIW